MTIQAIDWTVEQNVDIVNLSSGFRLSDVTTARAIRAAVAARNLLIFATAGSPEDDMEIFPAKLPDVISVRGASWDGKPIPAYNPESADNRTSPMFCTLALDVECVLGGPRESGCSIATPILAATAGIFLQSFEGEGMRWLINLLRMKQGMEHLFRLIGKEVGKGIWFVQPQDIFQYMHKDSRQLTSRLYRHMRRLYK